MVSGRRQNDQFGWSLRLSEQTCRFKVAPQPARATMYREKKGYGFTSEKIQLRNSRMPELEAVEIEAVADTGAVHMCITEHIRIQLQIVEQDAREVILADGNRKLVPYVGPIELRYKHRVGLAGALVMGDEPLLGLIPLQDMDLVVVSGTKRVIVNPLSPNIASSIAKRTCNANRYTKGLRRRLIHAPGTRVDARHIPAA